MKTLSAFFFFSTILFAAPNAELKLTKIVNLDNLETYDTHLVHGGYVWEGKIKRTDMENDTTGVYAFNLEGKKVKYFPLDYVPTHIFSHGPNTVVVTGKKSTPQWITYYTKIGFSKSGFTTKTTAFPAGTQVDHFVGDGKREIFTVLGERALLGNLKGGWSQVNKEEVIGPFKMILLKDILYVQNNHHLVALGAETLSKVDLKTGTVKIISGQKFLQGMTNLHYHEASDLLVFPEILNGAVTLFSPKTETVVGHLEVEDARGLASLGKCLAVSSRDKRTVSFFDLSTEERKLVSVWDLSSIGDTFKKATNIGIDETSGRLYARSTYLCTGCSETNSSAIMAEEPSLATLKACRN